MKKNGTNKKYWIGFSGGLDSHVLLTIVVKLRAKLSLNICAIHINHGLSQNAGIWALHCQHFCEQYQIPFVTKDLSLQTTSGESLEARARDERYAIVSELLSPNDIFITAHHQDDQAETLLLQLLRGAGSKGLSAMPKMKPLGAGYHARPLLSHTRAELESYAQDNKLIWVQDESNENPRFSRNFLRLNILPLLKTRWPTVNRMLARSAQHIQETENLLETYVQSELNQFQGSRLNTLSIKKINNLDVEKQKLLLRVWIRQAGFLQPNAKKLASIIKTVLNCQNDKMPKVCWQNAEIRRYRDDLFVERPQTELTELSFDWYLPNPINLPPLGKLYVKNKLGGLSREITKLDIRFRLGGEVIRGKHCRYKLKNLFQEKGIPPWERNRIPLLFLGDELIAAVGFFIAPHVCVNDDELGYDFVLQS